MAFLKEVFGKRVSLPFGGHFDLPLPGGGEAESPGDDDHDDHPFMHDIAGHAVDFLASAKTRVREKAAGAPRQPKAPTTPGGSSPPPAAAPNVPATTPPPVAAPPPPAASGLDHLVHAMTNSPRQGKALAGYVNLHPDEAKRLAVSPPPVAPAPPPPAQSPAQRPNSAVSPPPASPPPPAQQHKPLPSAPIDRTNPALDDFFASPPPPPAPRPTGDMRHNPDLDSAFGIAPPRPKVATPTQTPPPGRRPNRQAANPASPPAPTPPPAQRPNSAVSPPAPTAQQQPKPGGKAAPPPPKFPPNHPDHAQLVRDFNESHVNNVLHIVSNNGQAVRAVRVTHGPEGAEVHDEHGGRWNLDRLHHEGAKFSATSRDHFDPTTVPGYRPPPNGQSATQPPTPQSQQPPAEKPHERAAREHYERVQEWQRKNLGGANQPDQPAPQQSSGWPTPRPAPQQPPAQRPPAPHDPDATRQMPTPSGTTPVAQPQAGSPRPKVASIIPGQRNPQFPNAGQRNPQLPVAQPANRQRPLAVARPANQPGQRSQQQAQPTGFGHVVNAVRDLFGQTDTTPRGGSRGGGAADKVKGVARAVGDKVGEVASRVGGKVRDAVTSVADRLGNAADPTRQRSQSAKNPWADQQAGHPPLPPKMAQRALPVAKRITDQAATPAHKDVLANAAKWSDRVGQVHADKVAHLFGGDKQRAAKALSRVIQHLAKVAHSNGSGSEAFTEFGGKRFTVRKKAFDPGDLFTPFEPESDTPTVDVRHDQTAEFGRPQADPDACPECGGADAAPFRSPVYSLVCSHCGAKFELSRYGRKKGYPDALPVGYHAVTDHAGRFIRLAPISTREKGMAGQTPAPPLPDGDWADSDDDGEPTVPGVRPQDLWHTAYARARPAEHPLDRIVSSYAAALHPHVPRDEIEQAVADLRDRPAV